MRFLVTAGPTREPIDPVRFLTNRSSGKMGYAIAEAAIEAGHEVVLISGPVHLERPHGAALIPISTSDEMFDAVQQQVRNCDILVMCAAVADYKPKSVFKNKVKKRDANLSLELIPTRDILASLPRQGRQRSPWEPSDVDGKAGERSQAGKRANQYLVVGFAAETENVEANARKKLQMKNCDIVVANDVRVGMESDENEVIVLFHDGTTKKIPRAQKKIVARELVKIFENVCEKCLTKKIM